MRGVCNHHVPLDEDCDNCSPPEKTYVFTAILLGQGSTPEEAWKNCVEGLEDDRGEVPDEYRIEEDED